MAKADGGLLVLVVEDERIISMALESMLRGMGHRVLACVPSALEALAQVERRRPDLVLMDIHLEGEMDGIAAAEALRRQNGPPVAFATAYTDQATRSRAMALGPLAFLPKPVARKDIELLVAGLAAGSAR